MCLVGPSLREVETILATVRELEGAIVISTALHRLGKVPVSPQAWTYLDIRLSILDWLTYSWSWQLSLLSAKLTLAQEVMVLVNPWDRSFSLEAPPSRSAASS